MDKVKTKSFDLAIYTKGNINSKKLAIICPGLLDPKDYPHMKAHVDFLAEYGFLSLSFDPPGTWESKGAVELYTITNYLKAVDEIIEYFGNKPTIVMGHSLGGTVSMLAAIYNPHIEAFVAIMSPPVLMAARAINKTTERWKQNGVRVALRDMEQGSSDKKRFELPYSFLEDARKHNAVSGLSKLNKPKLFIFGDEDESVEPEIVIEAYNVSLDPKELFDIHCDHNYREHPGLITQVNVRVGKFIDDYNLGKAL